MVEGQRVQVAGARKDGQAILRHASSAGVERVFSAAGKTAHGDLQKSAKETTLEHLLFAAFNTD